MLKLKVVLIDTQVKAAFIEYYNINHLILHFIVSYLRAMSSNTYKASLWSSKECPDNTRKVILKGG